MGIKSLYNYCVHDFINHQQTSLKKNVPYLSGIPQGRCSAADGDLAEQIVIDMNMANWDIIYSD